jgi:serine/threonine protein kinase
VAHRDLKVNSPRIYLIIQTDNILINLSENGELSSLVICDFGISKDLNVSIADTYAGTWAWMVKFSLKWCNIEGSRSL